MKDASPTELLIFDGESYAKLLLDKINGATQEILVSSYIIEADEFGSKVLEALDNQAKRGVRIKLIADGYGSWLWLKEKADAFQHENFEIRIYRPIPWPFSQLRLKHLFRIDMFLSLFYHSNRRNHQKLFVFDRKTALIGSRNINNEAIEWKELSLFIGDDGVAEMVEIFDTIWIQVKDPLLRKLSKLVGKNHYEILKKSSRVFSNYIFSKRRRNYIYQKILDSKNFIHIETPYFFPTRKILKGLRFKSASGVKVSILLPKRSDVLISKWIGQYHYEYLLKSGIHIYEYKPSVLHAKFIHVDGWALIGSSNFNRRSALRDLELDCSVTDPKMIQLLDQEFKKDIQESVKIDSIPEMGILKKIFIMLITKMAPSWF